MLTVTDDEGATGTVSHVVTVTAPGGLTPLAADAFARRWPTVGARPTRWCVVDLGVRQPLSVNGSGRGVVLEPGLTLSSWLDGVSSTSTDLTATVSADVVPNGSGAWVHVQARRVSATAFYGARVRLTRMGRCSCT